MCVYRSVCVSECMHICMYVCVEELGWRRGTADGTTCCYTTSSDVVELAGK